MQNSLLVGFELYSKHSNVTKFVSHLHKVYVIFYGYSQSLK